MPGVIVGVGMQTIHVRVTGRVQGVCFRECTRQEALRLGVTGWVRNLQDGSVEALVQSDDDVAVEGMLDWIRSGPPLARVDVFQAEEATTDERFASFLVHYVY